MTDISKTLFVITTIVVTLVVIVVFAPALGRLLDNAAKLDPSFRAMEVASILSITQNAEEGFVYMYNGLPRRDQEGCLRIYQTYIAVATVGFDFTKSPEGADIVLKPSPGGPATPKSFADPIVVNCKPAGTNVVFRKKGGDVEVEVFG